MYDDKDAIALYMLAGPDSVRLIDQFESVLKMADSSVAHHEESLALQQRFITDVKKFMDVLRDRGNPFQEKNPDLYAIDTSSAMEKEVSTSLSEVDKVRKA